MQPAARTPAFAAHQPLREEAPARGAPAVPSPRRVVRTLARSLYRELVAGGFDDRQVIGLATELLGEVTARLGGPRGARVEDRA